MGSKVLEFENVFLRAPNMNNGIKGKYVGLISGVSGEVMSGRLSVIMGGSGSGKTSFLNLLVGRVEDTVLTSGIVSLSGGQRRLYEWLYNVSYLEQCDIFIPDITVEESIRYSLLFKKNECNDCYVSERVNCVIEELMLMEIRDSLLSYISGGERKRVMLAMELIVEPDVLFLDEPTTGLDSYLAFDTLKILNKYAKEKDKIVLMTVHQPSDGMFRLFDDVIFLDKGVILYSGPASDMKEFFKENGLIKPLELSTSEYLFEPRDEKLQYMKSFETLYLKGEDCKEDVEKQILFDKKALERGNKRCILSTVSWFHVLHLLSRQLKIDYRNGTIRNVLIFKILVSTVLFFFLYSKMQYSIRSLINKVYPIYTHVSERYVEDLKIFLDRNYDVFGVSYGDILDFFAYNMIPFLSAFSIFNDSTFLDRSVVLQKEFFKCNYSQISFIISVLIYEGIFSLIRTAHFCFILSLTQLRVVLTLRAVLMFTFVPLGVVVFMNMIKSFSSSTYPLNVARVAVFVLTTFLRPIWLSKELEELDARYTFMKYLYPVTYLLFLCPFLLVDAFFYMTLGENSAASDGLILFLKEVNGISIVPNVSSRTILSRNITFLNRHILPANFLTVLTMFSFASVFILSFAFLAMRLSPNVRTILSKKSIGKRISEITIN